MTTLAHLLTASVVLAQAGYKGRDLAELRRDMATQVSRETEEPGREGSCPDEHSRIDGDPSRAGGPQAHGGERDAAALAAEADRKPVPEPSRVILWAEPSGWRATCYACGHPVSAGSGHVGTIRSKGKTVVACESCFDEQMRELHASEREF